MSKRTRVHRSWAVDYDYEHKLSAEHLDFLEKFTDEFYRDDFRGELLHAETHKKGLYAANNAARRDIYTAPPHKVTQYRQDIPDHKPNIKVKFYFESDYCLTSANPEDIYIDIIDESQRPAKTNCRIVQLNSKRLAS